MSNEYVAHLDNVLLSRGAKKNQKRNKYIKTASDGSMAWMAVAAESGHGAGGHRQPVVPGAHRLGASSQHRNRTHFVGRPGCRGLISTFLAYDVGRGLSSC